MAKQVKEEWKDIPGYDGYYEISNTGRIRICNSGKILKQSDHTSGYKSVRLWNGSNYKNHYVHRLVAEAFIPNPDNKPTVNHKDENKKNNSANNLEWMTYLENNEYGNRKKKFILSRSKPVRAYDKYGKLFLSLRVHVQRKECSVLIIPTLDVVQMENQKQQAVIYGDTQKEVLYEIGISI